MILIFTDYHYYLFQEPGYLQGPLLMGNQLLFKTSNADGPLCGFSTLFFRNIAFCQIGISEVYRIKPEVTLELPTHFRLNPVS